jgi:hypothetical protein
MLARSVPEAGGQYKRRNDAFFYPAGASKAGLRGKIDSNAEDFPCASSFLHFCKDRN